MESPTLKFMASSNPPARPTKDRAVVSPPVPSVQDRVSLGTLEESAPTQTARALSPARSQADGPSDEAQSMIDTAAVAAAVGKELKNGESVTFTAGGRTILQVKKEGQTGFQALSSLAADTVHALAAEASNVVSQDPSFAFKEAALLVKGPVYNGVGWELESMANQAFLPMIRTVSFALDVKKCYETWKSERANRVDKVVDGSHLLTDVLGVGGAIAYAIPGVSQTLALGLTVCGVVGDVASFGYHTMKYFRERGLQYDLQASNERAAVALPPGVSHELMAQVTSHLPPSST